MPIDHTRWPRLYRAAVLVGAGFGLLLAFGLLPAGAGLRARWGALPTVAACVAVALTLAGVAHLGVRLQLRRGAGPRTD